MGKAKQNILAKKREKHRFQKIKNNPELYAEYQRNNIIKYEKLSGKKMGSIDEISSCQQKMQWKKLREERNRRYQLIKEKKAKKRENITISIKEECELERDSKCELPPGLTTNQIWIPELKEAVVKKEPLCEESIGTSGPTLDPLVIKGVLCADNTCIPEPKSKEKLLADKRQREKLRYQNIKNNPELYANYQRKNNIKYEKLKAQKKIVLINEMSARQQEMQREKCREERNRRYQRIKDKKAKERQLIIENSLRKSDIASVQLLDTAAEKETVTVGEIFCQENIGSCDPTYESHVTVVLKEDPLFQENIDKLKPKSKEELLADKRQREKLRYQNIKNNPELYANYQRKNNIKYEKLKAQKKIVLINEMSARQQEMQREKWREERNRRYQRIKDKKAKERQLIIENSLRKSDIASVQLLDTAAEKETMTVGEIFCQENIGPCDPTYESHVTVVLKQDPLFQENMDKLKPKSKEELLADKRQREKLRYQNIKNNPELYANYQRKNNIKYEKLKAQKKIVLINEMSARQQEMQREKWREERNRRYQRIKDKKAKERQLIIENSLHKSDIASVQLLDTAAEQERVTVEEIFCQENIGSSDQTHESHVTVVIKEDPLFQENMDKLIPKSKEEVLADKRHRERLRYQNMKNNPELYANHQRKNNIKYEKMKAQKKIVPINEMTARQQEMQRQKWRDERNRRYQRMKDKKAKERQLIMENMENSHESGIESVQLLDTPAEQETVTVGEIFCQENIGSCDPTHESHVTVVLKEDPLFQENMDKLKPKSKEELLADKRHRERLRYQNIKNNPELYANHQRKNNIKYEKLKAQKKIKKAKERQLIMENSHESGIESVQFLNAPKGQDVIVNSHKALNMNIIKNLNTPLKETAESKVCILEVKEEAVAEEPSYEQSICDTHDPLVIKEEFHAHDTAVIKNAFHSHDTVVIKECHPHDAVVTKKSNAHDTAVIKNAFHSHDTVVIKECHPHEAVVTKKSNAHDTAVIKNAFHSHDTVVIKECHPHDAVVIKKELLCDSRASDPLTSLYEDHEVKDEVVLGPECLQRPGAPAAPHTTVGSSSTCLQLRTTSDPQNTQKSPKPPSSKHKPKASSKKHPCQTCGKEFKRATHLKSHMLTHTGLKPFTCEVCKKEFAFIGNLRTHQRVHTGEKPFCCEICNMCFTNSGALKMHRRIHAGLKPHSCDICFKTFRASDTLNRHKRTHTGEKPYMCEICQKRFNETGELRKHKRTHTGEKPFSCEFCEKKFSQSSNLKNHQRIHTGEKPYACRACEKKFSQLINMKKHEKLHTRVTMQSDTKGCIDEIS